MVEKLGWVGGMFSIGGPTHGEAWVGDNARKSMSVQSGESGQSLQAGK